MKRLKSVFFSFFFFPLLTATAEEGRRPLLPAPQHIEYGHGELPVSGLSIGFQHTPSEADLFAASELVRMMREACGVELTIIEQPGAEANLVFNRTGEAPATPQLDERVGPDSREAYRIEINANGIKILANASAGLFYAVQTLKQLLEGEDSNSWFPVVKINDWPSMAYRGFMMDMTHMQLPKMDEIKRQLDFLAMWKTNQYYFYSEANIELERYPLLNPNARFTKQQIKEIIDYARERHIDVVPNVNLYGHLHDFFKYEHYADLAITPYGREFSSTDQRVEPIVADWVDQLSSMFSSPFFHIGFDETWLVELEAEKIGSTAEEIYLRMLNRTVDLVEAKGKRAMVYADMLQKHPEMIPEVPRSVMAVAWHYLPFTNEQYKQFLEPFGKNDIPLFIQSATYNYRWLYPATNVSFPSHTRLIQNGLKYGARGFINSGWTDDSQVLMRNSRPDMAYGSSLAWNYQEMADSLFWNSYSRILYPRDVADRVNRAHVALAKANVLTKMVFKYTASAIWDNPFTEKSLELIETNRKTLHDARLSAEDAQILLRQALKHDHDTATLHAMLTAAREIDMLTMKYLFAGRVVDIHEEYRKKREAKRFSLIMREVTAYYSSLTVDMFDTIVETKEMFHKAWLNEYTTYRLEIPMAKFDRELDFWYRVQRRLETFESYDPDEELPPLSELLVFD